MPGKAVLDTLCHAWRALEALKRPMAVMGGISVAVWEQVRATQDVDLLLGASDKDVDLVLQKLAQAKIRPKRQPPVIVIGETRILQCLYEPPDCFIDIQVDLLFADSAFHRTALTRRSPALLPGLDQEIAVVSCEDLILMKLVAGRILDRVDAAALLRANRVGLDLVYLLDWSDKLELRGELATIWPEAFPGETLPATPQASKAERRDHAG
jgi:hypothetical protein